MDICAAGFIVATAQESQIKIADIVSDKVVYLSHNPVLLEQLLGDKDKQNLMEKLANEHGLDHLIAVRGVFADGTFKNYW